MSPAPGTEVLLRETTPPRSAPTETGVWFTVGLADRGPIDRPLLITSLSDFERYYGKRQSYSILYDAVESFFREGGGKVNVSRVLGPAAVTATRTLVDGSAANVVFIRAKSPGLWGNNLTVQVVAGSAGGTFVLVIAESTVEVERSPDLVDKAAAIAWGANVSQYVDVIDAGVSALDPAIVAASALTTGADDQAGITDTHWKAALDKFNKSLGPGQVSFPGRTTAQAYLDLTNHAQANNRVAIIDGVDSLTVATHTGAAAALRAATANEKFAGYFAPWVKIPGVTPGTTRSVPPSGVVAGLIANNDAIGANPNQPAAGVNGQSRYGVDLTQIAWTDTERETLNNAGVNVIRMLYGGVRVYGWRTLVDPINEAKWVNLGNSRVIMAVAAEGDLIAERHVLKQIDGRGIEISKYGGELTGMLVPYYENGALYGDTPEEAFNVDVGSQVNTPATIAAGQLRAVIALKTSPFAERVYLELVKVAQEEAVA